MLVCLFKKRNKSCGETSFQLWWENFDFCCSGPHRTFQLETHWGSLFKEEILQYLQWKSCPIPQSLTASKINCCDGQCQFHMFKELEASVHHCGARLIFLPPCSPQLKLIELCFGQLKSWIQKYANLVFPLYLKKVLKVVMPVCNFFWLPCIHNLCMITSNVVKFNTVISFACLDLCCGFLKPSNSGTMQISRGVLLCFAINTHKHFKTKTIQRILTFICPRTNISFCHQVPPWLCETLEVLHSQDDELTLWCTFGPFQINVMRNQLRILKICGSINKRNAFGFHNTQAFTNFHSEHISEPHPGLFINVFPSCRST